MKNKTISIVDYAGSKAGMDYYSMSLATGIARDNIKVYIYSNFKNEEVAKVQTIPVFQRHVNNSILKFFDAVYGNLKAALLIKFNKSNFVIMHLFIASYFSLFQFFIFWLFNIKMLTIIHDVEGFDKEKLWIKKIILNRFSWKLIVHNKFSKDEILKSLIVKDERKIYEIKHGGYIEKLDIQKKVNKTLAFKHFNLSNKKKYILFFGQIGSNKGLEVLLKSMKSTSSNVNLIIAGKVLDWNPFGPYQKLIDELKLSGKIIKILRYIEDHEMHKLFSIVSISILPYIRSYQSGVLLMSMSNGVPVIVSDIEPMKEIIKNGENGLLFKTLDSLDLAKKINLFFENSEENYKKYSENAIKTVRTEYSWKNIGNEYCDFLNYKS